MKRKCREYFKFTMNLYKKLSKFELLNILVTNIQNETLESTLNEDDYIWFQYLLDKGESFTELLHMMPGYRLIKDNKYIGRFYYDKFEFNNMHRNHKAVECINAMTTIFNKFEKKDKDALQKEYAFTHSYIDNEKLIYYYSNILYHSCVGIGLLSITSNMDEKFFDHFIFDLHTKQEKQIMSLYRNQFLEFFDREFHSCFEKAIRYTQQDDVEMEELYDSLKI